MIVVMAVIMVMGVLVMLVAAAAVLAELVVMVVMLVNMVLTVFMVMVVHMLVIFTMVVHMILSMLMIIMMMVQALFLFAAHGDLHVGPCDAAFDGGLGLEDHARDAETVELVYKSLRIGQKLQKGGGQHVSGGSHAAVKV